MRTVKYVGPAEAVEIQWGAVSIGPVAHGETVEVPDEAFDGLVIQESNWQAVEPTKKAAAKKDEVQP
jgi:membrane-bound ClpP family serine protease